MGNFLYKTFLASKNISLNVNFLSRFSANICYRTMDALPHMFSVVWCFYMVERVMVIQLTLSVLREVDRVWLEASSRHGKFLPDQLTD